MRTERERSVNISLPYCPAVAGGRPLILTNGSGFSGASYKKFRTIEEAQAFVGLTPEAEGTDHDHPNRTNAKGSPSGSSHREQVNLPLRVLRGGPSSAARNNSFTGQRGGDATVRWVCVRTLKMF
jgi:hypothetical protein